MYVKSAKSIKTFPFYKILVYPDSLMYGFPKLMIGCYGWIVRALICFLFFWTHAPTNRLPWHMLALRQPSNFKFLACLVNTNTLFLRRCSQNLLKRGVSGAFQICKCTLSKLILIWVTFLRRYCKNESIGPVEYKYQRCFQIKSYSSEKSMVIYVMAKFDQFLTILVLFISYTVSKLLR